jgi:hypothetical protein
VALSINANEPRPTPSTEEMDVSPTSIAVTEAYYKDRIRQSSEMAPLMPLVHVCDCYSLRNILSTKKIQPAACPVFEEDLLYYFYGRPSYRVKDGGLASNTKSMFPVCFIIDPVHVLGVKRIYPFDTGAYHAGLYSNQIHRNAKCDDYEFDSSFEFVQKFVSMFYGSNVNYYDGTTTVTPDKFPVMGFEFHSLHQLINQVGIAMADDRSYTIEIQSAAETVLARGSVKAVVVPDDVMTDEALVDFLLENDVEALTYSSLRGAPSHITPLIIDKVRSYYIEQGVM